MSGFSPYSCRFLAHIFDKLSMLHFHVAICVLVMGAAILAPPAEGAMLLIPLHAGPGTTINMALAGGTTILGAGPLPGSLIVRGDRDAILMPLLRQGTLVAGATPMICGELPIPTE